MSHVAEIMDYTSKGYGSEEPGIALENWGVDVAIVPRKSRSDDEALNRLGKKSVLKRNFGFTTILAFSCTVLITWEGTLIDFGIGLNNGGPGGLIYGYIVVWIGTFSVFLSLSELASMAPTSGGQYHWVSMLAPETCHRFLSYMTGWLVILGWQATIASGGYFVGTLWQGLAGLLNTSYEFKSWHGTMLFWLTILFSLLINILFSSLLPKFEGTILILHIAGFFAVLIPLVILGSHGSTSDVFGTWVNGGEWPSRGLSFFVGLLGNVFAFFGVDAAVHMSEAIQHAEKVVPRSIITAITINGIMGFAMLIAVLFVIGDLEIALENPQPIIPVLAGALQSNTGAAIVIVLLGFMATCATTGFLASTSRILWSFARDRAVPGWRTVSYLSPRTTIPLFAVGISTIVPCLLALIIIGSPTAFTDTVGLSIVALFSSYLITAILLLWRRCTGAIKLYSQGSATHANVAGAELVWGPWKLPETLGIINNVRAILYLTMILFFCFWPSVSMVDASSMNYSVLMLGATMLFSVVYCMVWAQKIYTGPIVEV